MSSRAKRWAGMCLAVLAGCGPIEEPPPDRLVSRGQSLVAAPPLLHAGIFRPGTGDSALWTGLGPEELEEKDARLAERGLRLVDLNVRTREDGRVTYDGTWLPGEGAHALHVGLDWNGLVERWLTLGERGLWLTDLELSVEQGVYRYAGVWRAGTAGHAFYVGLGWKGLEAMRQSLRERGLRLVDVETYLDQGERRYAGVWRDGAGGEELWAGGRREELHAKVREFAAVGLRLVDLRAYWEDNDWKFLGLFRQG